MGLRCLLFLLLTPYLLWRAPEGFTHVFSELARREGSLSSTGIDNWHTRMCVLLHNGLGSLTSYLDSILETRQQLCGLLWPKLRSYIVASSLCTVHQNRHKSTQNQWGETQKRIKELVSIFSALHRVWNCSNSKANSALPFNFVHKF